MFIWYMQCCIAADGNLPRWSAIVKPFAIPSRFISPINSGRHVTLNKEADSGGMHFVTSYHWLFHSVLRIFARTSNPTHHRKQLSSNFINVMNRPRKFFYTGIQPENWCHYYNDLHLPCGVYTLNHLEERSDSEFDINIIFIDSWFGDVHFCGLKQGPERDTLVNAMSTLSCAFPSAQLLLAIVSDHDCDQEAKSSYPEEIEVRWSILFIILTHEKQYLIYPTIFVVLPWSITHVCYFRSFIDVVSFLPVFVCTGTVFLLKLHRKRY